MRILNSYVNVAATEKRRFRVTFDDSQLGGRRYFIDVKIEGITVRHLIDTGSEVSCISGAYLRSLESKIGRKFIKLDHGQRLCGITGEHPPNLSSLTSFNLLLQNQQHDLYLDNVTYFVIQDAPFTAILGQNVMETLQTSITNGGGLEAVLTFRKLPEFGEISIQLSNDDKLALEVSTAALAYAENQGVTLPRN